MNRTKPNPDELLGFFNHHRSLQSRFATAVFALDALAPAAILLFAYFATGIALRLFADVPLHDDWTYAWSVEHFLKTGKLQVLDWSIHYPFAQILWGALFCLPFGFSFSALRVSTVVLAWLGSLALYGTLREVGRARTESLIASLVLIVNPVFYLLSFSFMTDVPFVSISNIAFFFIVRGFSRTNALDLWIGCAFGVIGFFVRQLAIAIPGAVLLYVMFEPSLRSRQYLLPPLVSSLLICFTPYLIAHTMGLTSQYTGREWVLDKWLHQPELGIPGLLRIMMHSGLALFPMTMPLMGSYYRRLRFWCVLGLLLLLTGCAILFTPEIPKPLDGMWNLIALGKERRLLRGAPDPDFLPSWLNYPLLAFSLFSFAGIVIKVIDVARDRKTIAPLVLVRLQPVRPYHGRLALRRVGFRSLFDRAAAAAYRSGCGPTTPIKDNGRRHRSSFCYRHGRDLE